jgi:hypothetical protein
VTTVTPVAKLANAVRKSRESKGGAWVII